IGRCVGFHFPENFNHPYTCTSMTDFWRRWHMSLGSFFRDYVYIPMGGNRRHQALNIMTVWFLTGMWHGASWNFIIWGVYFGLIIMIEKYTLLRWNIPRIGLYIYSIFLILVGWGLFYFDDFGRMSQFFTAFFGQNEPQGLPMHVETVIIDNLWLWVAAIILCLPVRKQVEKIGYKMAKSIPYAGNYTVQFCHAVVSIVILCCCVALLVGATNNAFIYTRF
ncbi:MAG: MBOAT family protein, partial [Muribaculaceae bacterium]|nr:MBOAT family protein [Muribaculaceae bacterium]